MRARYIKSMKEVSEILSEAKAVLKISLKDKNVKEILDLVVKDGIPYELSSKGLHISASSPKFNKTLEKIMKMADDYVLSSEKNQPSEGRVLCEGHFMIDYFAKGSWQQAKRDLEKYMYRDEMNTMYYDDEEDDYGSESDWSGITSKDFDLARGEFETVNDAFDEAEKVLRRGDRIAFEIKRPRGYLFVADIHR